MTFKLTLQQRIVMLVVAAIVPLLGMALVNAWRNADRAVSRATDHLKFAASLVAASQERMADSARQLLMAVANAPGLDDGRAADCQRYLRTLNEQFPVYANLGLIGADGYLRCNGLVQPSQEFAGDRDYFQAAVARRDFVASGYLVGRILGKPIITFAMPVMNREGHVSAVAFVAVDLNEMAKALVNAPLPPGSQVVIMDRQGVVLAAGPEKSALTGQQVTSPLLREAVKTMRTGVSEGPDAQGRQRIFAFLPAGKGADAAFLVAVSADRDGVLAPVQTQLGRVLALLVLVALVGGWLAWRMGGRFIVKPTTEILEAIRQIGDDRLDVRIPAPSPHDGGEFSRIAAGFNLMAESLQRHQGALEAELARSRAAQAKLQDAQRFGGIGYWQADLDTSRIWLSAEACELLDVAPALFDGSEAGFLQRIHPDDRDGVKSACAAAVEAGLPLESEFRIVTSTDEVRWLQVFGGPHANADGKPAARRAGVIQDITRRKLAEQALMDSEQRYVALFEAAPVPMWVFDLATTRFLMVNQAARKSYGYSASEFLTKTIFDIRPEAEHSRLRQKLDELETVKRGYWQHRRKDGSLFPVDIVSQPIQYAGRAARFVVALDRSAQVKAEKDVQEYLFTLQRAADAAQAITWHQTLEGAMQEIADQARGVVGAHQAVVTLFRGGDPAQALQVLSLSEKYAAYRGLMKSLDGSGIYALVCETNRSIRLTQAELEAHPRWRGFGHHADKHPAMRGWLAVPLAGRNGENIGLLQLSDKYEGEFTQQDEYVALELGHLASAAMENARLLQEISQLNAGLEHKVAERTAALTRQEALFRALSEQAPQMVWTASPDGGATYFNRAWFELMGGELKDWCGNQWLAVVHPEDVTDIKGKWKNARESQSAYAGIRRLLARDGSFHTMAYRAAPVFDEQGEVAFWVGIDADITEIKAIEAALRLSNQELEAFSYSVSHDLRSPLNTVDGFSRLLAKQLAPQLTGEAGEKAKHYLKRIHAGVAQMGQLIEDLLSLSQVTRAPLHTEPVDLSAMARSLLDDWQARQPARQVSMHIESGLQAEADGRLVRVVMENLLSNAWKFTSQLAQAEIHVGQKFDDAGLPVFFVKDNGAGFDMAFSDKLFNPFQRLHAASEFSGTGIGLATVSRIVKRHGGRIWAEAAPACGATFFFTLPQVRRVV